MTVFTDLQSVKLLSDLNDRNLRKIERITSVETYPEGGFIFRENQYADDLYAVVQGKVALELTVNTSRCRVKDVFPGESFGISSVVDTGMRTYIADAIAVRPSKVFRWGNSALERMFYEDCELGFIFMRNVGKVLKKRLQYTRAQLADGMYCQQYQTA